MLSDESGGTSQYSSASVLGEGTKYLPVAQLARSWVRQRALQNGAHLEDGAAGLRQMGQLAAARVMVSG